MKVAVVVKVDGGYLIFPDDVFVTEKKVSEGSFTPATYSNDSWDIVAKIAQAQQLLDAMIPIPAPEAKDDIPF